MLTKEKYSKQIWQIIYKIELANRYWYSIVFAVLNMQSTLFNCLMALSSLLERGSHLFKCLFCFPPCWFGFFCPIFHWIFFLFPSEKFDGKCIKDRQTCEITISIFKELKKKPFEFVVPSRQSKPNYIKQIIKWI